MRVQYSTLKVREVAMNKTINILLGLVASLGFTCTASAASQYNMSLGNETATAYNGAVTHPDAANANTRVQINEKQVMKIADGIYRIGGWGIGNTIAIEGPDGWVIVDTGDYLEMAQEQRQALEAKVGKIKVVAILYTHNHYVFGAKAWLDEGTEVYAHENVDADVNADTGVGVLAGNFMRRVVQQFGLLHPSEGPDAFPNHLGFSVTKLLGTNAYVAPTITFKDEETKTHTIGGLAVEVFPCKTDVASSVCYFFPEKKVLASNALGLDMIFNLYTLRGDWYRDPRDMMKAADFALTRDIEYLLDIHGSVKIGKKAVTASLEDTRDQMQLIHDQTYRAIAQGMDAQEAAEWVYMPANLRKNQELYGQVESHVKRVYSARIGWMGNDPYDINPLSKASFSRNIVAAMGGYDTVLKAAKAANAEQKLERWQWAMYLTSELMQLDASNAEAKQVRAEAARALGQRTSSANARGFYITEALLHEGKLAFGEHTITDLNQLIPMLGAVTPEKLAASPLNDNIQYLRYMVDSRQAEGKRAQFNVNFKEEGLSYGIALRNGVIVITEHAIDARTLNLSKADWDQLIIGEKSFASLHSSLKAFDQVIGR
jgi:alkyl sulfatase BDS1-like metallo-beta-lactamase superfamily hydrolase